MMSTLMHSSTDLHDQAKSIEYEMVTKLARCLKPDSDEWNRFLEALSIYFTNKELGECHNVFSAFDTLKKKNVIRLGRYTQLMNIFQCIKNIKCQNMVNIYWQKIQEILGDSYSNTSVSKCFGWPLATSEVTSLHYQMIAKLCTLLDPSTPGLWKKLKRNLRRYLAPEVIENIQNIGKMCDLLFVEKQIWYGNYEVLKRIFSELGHHECYDAVDEFTQNIVEEWMN